MPSNIWAGGFFLLFGLLSACFPVRAGQAAAKEAVKIDLSTAIEKALESSEDLLISRNSVEKSRADYKKEKSALYPQITGTGKVTHNFEYPGAAQGTQDYFSDVGVSLDQLLWSFGKVRAAINAQDKYMDVARFNEEAMRQAVIYNAKVSYFSVKLADHSYDILLKSLHNAEDNKRILEDRSASGRVSRRDFLKASADVAARQPLVNDAEKTRHTAYQEFKVMIGMESSADVLLSDEFEREYQAIDGAAMLEAMNVNEPALKALSKEVELREDLVHAKKASFLPEVSSFATWNHKGDDQDPDPYGPNMDDYGSVGVKVSVPIWTGGFLKGDLQAARIQKRDSELGLRKAQEQFGLALDQAIASYHDLIKTLGANNEAVRLAEESFHLTQDFFKTGSATLTDLNDAELQLTQQRLNRERTIYNICVMLARIEQLTLRKDLL